MSDSEPLDFEIHMAHEPAPDLTAELEAARRELATAERKNREYFALIEKVIAQREEWIRLYHQHVTEHTAAQMLLERKIVLQGEWLLKAFTLINGMRKERGLEPYPTPESVEPPTQAPVGTCEAYWARMRALTVELKKGMLAVTDAIAERDGIAAS